MQRVKKIEYDDDDDDDLYDEEEDYAEGEQQGYTTEDRENFATLTPVVRAELDEAGLQASDREIEEALWHYYWDVGKSVAYLKNSRTSRPSQQEQKKEKPKTKFDEAAEKAGEWDFSFALVVPSGSMWERLYTMRQRVGSTRSKNSKQTSNGLVKKTEVLKLDAALSPSPAQPKVNSKGLDVPELWAEEKSKRKLSAAFVVIGHVDHGKSTLMGRLLLDTGAVSQRDIDKYRKQATELGKSSFALAWVMDTGAEERERGITVDIAQHHFSTSTADFTILDAPGHRDFVPNMIGGASMADLAVLVVDANQLESGMKGQTREHVLLAKACGIERMVVAVNKLDATMPKWDERTFTHVSKEISEFLIEAGFEMGKFAVIPCSGLSGQNVVKPEEEKGDAAWVANASPTLLQELERSVQASTSEDSIKAPLRMQIADVFRGGVTNPLSVSGRITAGNAQVGDTVLVQPSGETATIRGVEVAGSSKDFSVATQISTLHLADIDGQHIRAGDVLCSTSKPISVVKTFVAQVQALESLLPQGVDVHVGRLHVPGKVDQLVATTDAEGEVLKRKPRVVKEGQRALVRVVLEAGTALGKGERVVLRGEGRTVAAGRVV